MPPDDELAALIAEQARDNALRRSPRLSRTVRESEVAGAELGSFLDSIPDPTADTEREAEQGEELDDWAEALKVGLDEADEMLRLPPTTPLIALGTGLVGWCPAIESSTEAGKDCPVCRGWVPPRSFCLACTRTWARMEVALDIARRRFPQAIVFRDAIARVEDSKARYDATRSKNLAERKWAAREARRLEKAAESRLVRPAPESIPAAAETPKATLLVRIRKANGQGEKFVRPEQVPMYVGSGLYVDA